MQLRDGRRVTWTRCVIDWVRAAWPHYKAPRAVVFVAKVPRMPNGKPDYPTTKDLAEQATRTRSTTP